MKQKIPCPCDNTFTVDVPREINLDENKKYIDELTDGSFMSFNCPKCGKKHKPEFPMFISWPSHNIRLEVFPELDRGDFYRLKKNSEGAETVIGYPELADRVAQIRDGLEPMAVEAIKYYLLVKAEQTYPDEEISAWYQNKGPGGLEFHLHGIKDGEIAVTRVPAAIYEKTLKNYQQRPKDEIFTSLRFRSYLSIQNMMRPEELK
jgi:hypothetical protein